MGACCSKPKKNDDREEGFKSKPDDKCISNGGGRKDEAINGKKSKARNYLSEDSGSTSDSSSSRSGFSSGKDSSRKKVRNHHGSGRTTNTTIIHGDNNTIGQGSRSVHVKMGDRSNRRPGSRKKREKRLSQREVPKPDFSKLERRYEDATSQPRCFMQLTDNSENVAYLEVLMKAAKSVGKIHAADNCATVFRVGPRYVMTAKHVLDGILQTEANRVGENGGPERFEVLTKKSVFVDFDYTHQYDSQPVNTTSQTPNEIKKFYLTGVVKYQNELLDVAVLELAETDGVEFPNALTSFRNAFPNKGFTFIGHPSGMVKKYNKVEYPVRLNDGMLRRAIEWSNQQAGYNGFVGIDKPERLLFHCSFQQGGSGSPGIAVEGGRTAVVVTMLQCGYPSWLYDQLSIEQIRAQGYQECCIEQGVNMASLYDAMHQEDPDLCAAIFGQNSTEEQ